VRLSFAALLFGLALPLLAAACAQGHAEGATVAIRYSRFEPEVITARVGEPLTITLRNDDPIEHEWIVGSDDVHERHRTGTEPYHASRPTEVTVPALSSRVTTVVFDQPGEYAYICHLPGHESYGMTGTLRVEEA
jgi:uncharacterized cupredoxin-like copper-binding protein